MSSQTFWKTENMSLRFISLPQNGWNCIDEIGLMQKRDLLEMKLSYQR